MHNYSIGLTKNIYDTAFKENCNYMVLFWNLANQQQKSLIIGMYFIHLEIKKIKNK